MNSTLAKLSPSIVKMIRADHSHVFALLHRFHEDTSAQRKKAIVETACLALEIHAQLEEEIFYPALREVAPDNEALKKSVPEHQEMRRVIERLRGMEPDDANFDVTFNELMRDVLHHVADEETVVLPSAELLLKDRLGELGAQMTQRRMQLSKPHIGQMIAGNARAMPAGTTMLMAGGLLAGGYLIKRAFEQRRH